MTAIGAVTDDTEHHRYTISADGTVVGYIEYHDREGNRALLHTVVEDAWEGHGIGSKLVRGALDDLRQHGRHLLPYCPFVRSYLERHRDDVDLVPPDRRAEFGL